MSLTVFQRRLAKVGVSLIHPVCWKALASGVAPAIEHLSLLRTLDVDGIIDVGANRGQFSLACRIAAPEIPILAFEPIPEEADLYAKVHSGGKVVLKRCALGETASTATLYLSRSLDSSSLLPIGKLQVEAYPETGEAGTITVDVRTLDSFLLDVAGRQQQLLKIDVQGYEFNVLRGAGEMLKLCRFVYVECSEVALYDGQALRQEVAALLAEKGFLKSTSYNHSYSRGKLIQADFLFAKE